MRVTLLHNSSAGSEDHTDEDLVETIRRAGHEVNGVVSNLDELTATLRSCESDLVAVAGGDGTVGRAACELAGGRVPLAILPLGTANNTALTLGIRGKLIELVSAWSRSQAVGFDLGTVTSADVRMRFSEAVGWGVFPAVMHRAKRMSDPGERRQTLERDRRLFQALLETAEPRPYEVEVDGEDFSGNYLMVEVLNIPFIGPRLELSPGSMPSDGHLELVLAGKSEKAGLLELVRRGRTSETPTQLAHRKAPGRALL